MGNPFKKVTDSIFPGVGSAVSGMFSGLVPNPGDGGAAEMRAQEEERQRKVRESVAAVNQVFGGDGAPGQFTDDYFKGIADAYSKFQQPLFDEQAAVARRELPYGFASTDSSSYIQKKGELERDIARQGVQIRDQGTDFSNKQRASVEQNRSDLVQMANAGTDAGTIAQLSNARASALAKPPVFSPVADLFQKYTALAANGAQAQNPALNFQNPLLFTRGSTMYNAPGGSSVRYIGG